MSTLRLHVTEPARALERAGNPIGELERFPWMPSLDEALGSGRPPMVHMLDIGFKHGARLARLCSRDDLSRAPPTLHSRAPATLLESLDWLARVDHAGGGQGWRSKLGFLRAWLLALDLCRDSARDAALRSSLQWQAAAPMDWISDEPLIGRAPRLGACLELRDAWTPDTPDVASSSKLAREIDGVLGPAHWFPIIQGPLYRGAQHEPGPASWLLASRESHELSISSTALSARPLDRARHRAL